MSNKRSTYKPTIRQTIIRRMTIGAVCITVVGGAAYGGATVKRAIDSEGTPNTAYGNTLTIQPCIEEDSRNCVWNADEVGNGEGVSFIDYNGTAYYPER